MINLGRLKGNMSCSFQIDTQHFLAYGSIFWMLTKPASDRIRSTPETLFLTFRSSITIQGVDPIGSDLGSSSETQGQSVGSGKKAGRKSSSKNSFSWILFVTPYTTAIVSPHSLSSFTKLVRTGETVILYFPNQKQRNNRGVEKRLGYYQQRAIEFAPRIFCFWRITIKMQRRWEIQISNSLTRQNNNFARASRFFVHFFSVNCTSVPVKMLNFTFCKGRKQAITKFILFMNFDMPSEEFVCIWQIKRVGSDGDVISNWKFPDCVHFFGA